MKNVCKIIEKIRNTQSRKEKEQILMKNKDNELLRKVLFYAYDADMKYKIKKEMDIEGEKHNNYDRIFEYLDYLSNQSGIDKEEKEHIWSLINGIEDEDIRKLFKCIVLKDLKMGVGIKTINKVFKKTLVKEFKIMLAKPSEHLEQFINKNDEFYVNYKYDGVRCICEVIDGKITLISRNGEEYDVPFIKKMIKESLIANSCTLDGEITFGNNDLQELMKLMRRKEYTEEHIKMFDEVCYNIFDCLSFNGVNIENKLLSERIKYIPKSINSNKHICYVKYDKIKSDINKVYELLDEALELGYEGLILKADKPYVRKKSIDWVKVKKKDNLDVRVIDIEEGKGKYKNKIGALVCELDNGKIVRVGSGLTDEFRDYYWKNKNEIIDKYIEIEFMELTKDGIPRFPTFKMIREDKN